MNAIQYSTIRPGYLVSLKTSVTGGVHYDKKDLGIKQTNDGAEVAEWETIRTITDKKEYEAANKLRMKARSIVRRCCAISAFGLLCPDDKQAELEAAIKEAREMTLAFNRKANICRVDVYVIAGRVAQDDVEAIKAIKGELRGLIENMRDGVKNLNAKAIREAAKKARQVSAVLAPDAQEKVKAAIKTARDQATKIVAAGEQAALEIDKNAVAMLTNARTAFLDLDEEQAEVAKPKAKSRAVDLGGDKGLIDSAVESTKAMRKAKRKATTPQLELD